MLEGENIYRSIRHVSCSFNYVNEWIKKCTLVLILED